MCGILGIVAALTHPERLNSLVLVNTPFKLPGAVMDTYNLGEPDHASAIEKYGVGGWCAGSSSGRYQTRS